MPPKSNKAAAKKANQLVEDKTFGMKNKNKSAKAKKYIEQLHKQVNPNQGKSQTAGSSKKDKDDLAARETILKPIQVQKVPFGTDPKSVLCEFFKAGLCERGSKCKFSHNLEATRKTTKIDVYTDARESNETDTMDKWDQKKLEEVVNKKAGNQPPTDIVCKYFLEAIENSKYGWFWECPNGGDNCKYKHALPPGFVLKSQAAKKSDKAEISLEEFLETERHKLGSNLTPVTLESFNAWKASRIAKKEADQTEARKAKETRWKAGRSQGMSGRDLFDFNPMLAADGDDDGDALDLNMYDRTETERERDLLEQERFSGKFNDLSLQSTTPIAVADGNGNGAKNS